MKSLAIIVSLICASVHAECWYDFQPAGAVNDKGILADVVSRSGKPAYFQQKYAHDLATQCHEATHLANTCVCNAAGSQGFYVGGGKCCILPEPRLTLLGVAQFVPAQQRGPLYQFYLVQQPTSQQILNSMPLYVLDEWSASINGWQAALENGVPDTGDAAMAKEFCRYADALVAAIRQRDPQYARLKELTYFVEWQKNRVMGLSKAPGKSVFVGGIRGLEQVPPRYAYGGACYSDGCCQQGNCYGGSCGPTVITGPVYQGQVVRPPMPPQQSRPNNPALPSPPPAAPPSTPTAPPQSSHANTGCECVPKWQSMSVRITNIEADISGIKNQKPEQPQPATINFLGVDDKVIATAQVVPGGTTNVKLPPIHMRVLDQRGAGYSTDYQPAPLGSFVTLPFGPVTQ